MVGKLKTVDNLEDFCQDRDHWWTLFVVAMNLQVA
jgi:hypothetical protein